MKALFSVATLLSLAIAANAQYTPGGGGYAVPSVPVVPGPTAPQGPAAPTPPTYSWEAPPQGQPVQPVYPAQPVVQPVAAPASPVRIVAPDQAQAVVPQLSDAQLSDLTASIALYPDVLLAEMFPAALYPDQLAWADRWLMQHPGADEASINALPVADPVHDLMHYPTVLTMMADHLDWTQAVALSFTYQRQGLFDAIQRWRALAVANGYLFSTPQQDILQQGQIILIQPPRQTQVIYVPVYDPTVVFVRSRPPVPARNVITFAGSGFSLNFAFNDLDWRDHEVRVPRHDDPHVPLTPGHVTDRVVFVPTDIKSHLTVYPDKVVTPQPDKHVIVLPPSGRGTGNPGYMGGPGGPGGPGAPGTGQGRGAGGRDNNPATPW